MGDIVILACSECKRRNYTTPKSKTNKTKRSNQSAKTAQKTQKPAKLQLMKYCPFDRKHTLHKETK